MAHINAWDGASPGRQCLSSGIADLEIPNVLTYFLDDADAFMSQNGARLHSR
jgi:hypothetical protein